MRPLKEILSGKAEGTGTRISKTTAFLILFCVLLVLITAGVTARYIQKTDKNDVAVAKEFYFKSDLLDGNTHTIAPTDSDGKGSITITLMNHADELRYSEVDIDYTVSVEEVTDSSGSSGTASSNSDASNTGTGTAVQAGDGNSSTTTASGVTIDKPTGKIENGKVNNYEVKISGLQPGKTYKVTATTNNTYSKTLTGTIKVNPIDSELHASVTDKTQYIEVNVWSVDKEHNVTLTYCEGLIPDNTDSLMSSAQTATTGTLSIPNGSDSTISLGKNESHMFRFFKTDTSSNYNASVSGTTVVISKSSTGASSDTSSNTTAS